MKGVPQCKQYHIGILPWVHKHWTRHSAWLNEWWLSLMLSWLTFTISLWLACLNTWEMLTLNAKVALFFFPLSLSRRIQRWDHFKHEAVLVIWILLELCQFQSICGVRLSWSAIRPVPPARLRHHLLNKLQGSIVQLAYIWIFAVCKSYPEHLH